MNAYRLLPDRIEWSKLNSIEGTHTVKIPGIICPKCGIWAMTGVIYPSANVEAIVKDSIVQSYQPITISDFNNLAMRLQSLIGIDFPIHPGTELGPLCGKAKGRFGDFAWVNPWTPLLREKVWVTAKNEGFQITGIPAKLAFYKQKYESFVELEALEAVLIQGFNSSYKCDACGRYGLKLPEKLILNRNSFNSEIPIQRIKEFPTVLIANESFAEFIRKNDLQDIILERIEVS